MTELCNSLNTRNDFFYSFEQNTKETICHRCFNSIYHKLVLWMKDDSKVLVFINKTTAIY